jgi:hypothetical protein
MGSEIKAEAACRNGAAMKTRAYTPTRNKPTHPHGCQTAPPADGCNAIKINAAPRLEVSDDV